MVVIFDSIILRFDILDVVFPLFERKSQPPRNITNTMRIFGCPDVGGMLSTGFLLLIVLWCFAITQCVIPTHNMSNVEKNQLK